MEEIWKNVKEYNNYQVSNLGRIKNIKTQKILKPFKSKTLPYYSIKINGSNRLLHRMIAETFINNSDKLPVVNHINGNKLDNRVENLEWCSYRHNILEAVKLGLMKPKYNSYQNRIRAKKVKQYDLEGKYIKTYLASTDAEKELKSKGIKVNAKNIRNVCNGIRKKAGGYIWRYVDE